MSELSSAISGCFRVIFKERPPPFNPEVAPLPLRKEGGVEKIYTHKNIGRNTTTVFDPLIEKILHVSKFPPLSTSGPSRVLTPPPSSQCLCTKLLLKLIHAHLTGSQGH